MTNMMESIDTIFFWWMLASWFLLCLYSCSGQLFNQWIKVTPGPSVSQAWPQARYGHSAVWWNNKMVLFGGVTADMTFLNDVWQYDFVRKEWTLIMANQNVAQWTLEKDSRASAIIRRGVVPARPAGRYGHTAVVAQVKSDVGVLMDVMTVFGGQSPNCSDYCRDFWHYTLEYQEWTLLYGEWWGVTQVWQSMYDFTGHEGSLLSKRWLHSAVSNGTHMFVFGGHRNGSSTACCSWSCAKTQSTPDAGCSYLNDLWYASIANFIPFEEKVSLGQHASQSSTAPNGFAQLAVDGNTRGVYSETDGSNSVSQTFADAQAWWQVDLGGRNFITNITIYNRVDAYPERLSNFYILISTSPFLSDRLQDLLLDSQVWKYHFMYMVSSKATVYVNELGNYVRIQLAGTDYLALAEVEIWGYPPIQDWENFEGYRTWTQVPKTLLTPKPRAGHQSVLFHDKAGVQKILSFGGYVKEEPYFLDEWYLYSFDTMDWTRIEPKWQQPSNNIISARYGHSMVLYQDQVFIFGGQSGYRSRMVAVPGSSLENQVFDTGYMNDLWIYNVSCNVATLLTTDRTAQSPVGRQWHTMVQHGNDLFIFGGKTDQTSKCPGGVCGDMWSYTFQTTNSCPLGCSRHGVCDFGFCICDEYRMGSDCSNVRCPQTTCTYDYTNHYSSCVVCSNRGYCATNGTCICPAGYTASENCAYLTCGTNKNCSSHGVCKAGGICDCDYLFKGIDCEIATCIDDCSLQGDCVVGANNKSHCVCGDAFTGDACDTEIEDVFIAKLANARAMKLEPVIAFSTTCVLFLLCLLEVYLKK